MPFIRLIVQLGTTGARLGNQNIRLGNFEPLNVVALGEDRVECGNDPAELGRILDSGVIIRVDTAVVSYRGPAPTLRIGIRVAAGRVAVAGRIPRLGLRIPVRPGQLLLSGRVPSVGTGFSPGAGRITVRGFAPVLRLRIPVGVASIQFRGRTPVVDSDNILIIPVGTPADIQFTGLLPQLIAGTTARPDPGTITVRGLAPVLRLRIPVPVASDNSVVRFRLPTLTTWSDSGCQL